MFHYIVLNIIYICVCAIFVDIIICVLFVERGQSISCDNFLSNPNAVLRNDHLTSRGWGYGFFSKKNILIPNVAEKNILILVEKNKII